MLLCSIFVTCLLLAFARTTPIERRAIDEVVQGALGSDGYWNVYDGGLNNYVMCTGNGSSANWPSQVNWLSFNDMWTINKHVISRSCDLYYNVSNVSDDEMNTLYNAIQSVAHTTRVDHRFIFAVIMQETKGCVRAKTSVSPNGEVRNPGLMQDHEGTFSCNNDGKVQTPCPEDQIVGMIQDGVGGTSQGDGLAGAISQQSSVEDIEFAEAYYRAARVYNSGLVDESGDLGKGTATHCYASDIANRLVGWVDAPTKCTLDSS